MQRTIKFRVWNNPLGQYIDEDYNKKYFLNFNGNLCSFNDFGLVLELDMKNYIIEQYTGLKDKNGVEIYEGDILKGIVNNGSEIYDTIKYKIYVGVDGAFRYEQIYDDGEVHCSESNTVNSLVSKKTQWYYFVQVIGNIHEVDKNER